ncbi:cytochrome-c peroxidase [Magnetofaba australis]|nr:cytochrome c peroxidase [Magnetofaba australis]
MIAILPLLGAILIVAMIASLLVWSDLCRMSSRGRRRCVVGSALMGVGLVALSIKVAAVWWIEDALAQSRGPVAPIASRLHSVDWRNPIASKSPGRFETVSWRALPARATDPLDNPTTVDKATLGRKLFLDRRLSRDGSVACVDCHALDRAGVDGRPRSLGVDGQVGARNAPSVYNAAFLSRLFWDGRAASLEEQALGPIANPVEMGVEDLNRVLARLRRDAEYPSLFAQAFSGEESITQTNLARALAAFERTLIQNQTRYDRFVRGEGEFTPLERRGMRLFHSVGCRQCHQDPTFSAAGRIGAVGAYRPFPRYGGHAIVARYALTEDAGNAMGRQGVWRVPSLRNVARTAPYFHNGAVTELEEAVRIMGLAQLNRQLSEQEVRALSAFLRTLSGSLQQEDLGLLSGESIKRSNDM